MHYPLGVVRAQKESFQVWFLASFQPFHSLFAFSRYFPGGISAERHFNVVHEQSFRRSFTFTEPSGPERRNLKVCWFCSLGFSHIIGRWKKVAFVIPWSLKVNCGYSRLQLRWFRVPVLQYTLGWSKTPADYPTVYRGSEARKPS